MIRRVDHFSFGIETVLKDGNPVKFASAALAAAAAQKEGFSFIVEYDNFGNQTIVAWNIKVVSKDEALRMYVSDGDKRSILRASKAKVWLIAPNEGYSDILIPFEGKVKTLKVMKLEELLKV